MSEIFQPLCREIYKIPLFQSVGHIVAIDSGGIRVAGLQDVAALGDRVEISGEFANQGQVVSLSEMWVQVICDSSLNGLALGDEVRLGLPVRLLPTLNWMGRIIDPLGHPLDDRQLFSGQIPQALESHPPVASRRRRMGERLSTGIAVFDTFLPIVRGQRIGLFAGSGVGKSTLLGQLVANIRADVVIVALIGERGRELREFAEHVLGVDGMRQTIIVAATSDQSAPLRRMCLYSAMALAEFYRDQGMHVLLVADSITRFAEAHREVASWSGEPASLGGYAPSIQHEIMALAERAGPGEEGQGDITAIFSVLVAGSDMEGTIADILRGVLDGHVVLQRSIAERGRYPAVDVLRSVSRSLPRCASDEENTLLLDGRSLLTSWDASELLVKAGLYVAGTDPILDRAIKVWPKLDKFLSEVNIGQEINENFDKLRHVLSGQSNPV